MSEGGRGGGREIHVHVHVRREKGREIGRERGREIHVRREKGREIWRERGRERGREREGEREERRYVNNTTAKEVDRCTMYIQNMYSTRQKKLPINGPFNGIPF